MPIPEGLRDLGAPPSTLAGMGNCFAVGSLYYKGKRIVVDRDIIRRVQYWCCGECREKIFAMPFDAVDTHTEEEMENNIRRTIELHICGEATPFGPFKSESESVERLIKFKGKEKSDD
jgi:hypothetical protein